MLESCAASPDVSSPVGLDPPVQPSLTRRRKSRRWNALRPHLNGRFRRYDFGEADPELLAVPFGLNLGGQPSRRREFHEMGTCRRHTSAKCFQPSRKRFRSRLGSIQKVVNRPRTRRFLIGRKRTPKSVPSKAR